MQSGLLCVQIESRRAANVGPTSDGISGNLSIIVEPNTSVAYHDLAEGGVLLNVESGEYFSLNEIGRQIWSLISGPTKLSDVVDQLADSVDEPPDSFETEVRGFIEALIDQELLLVVD
jgi:hypothetical protein